MKKIYLLLLLVFLLASFSLWKLIFSRNSHSPESIPVKQEAQTKPLAEPFKDEPVKVSEPSPPVLSTSLLNPPQEQKGIAPSPESLAASAKAPPDGTYKTYYHAKYRGFTCTVRTQ
jgi:hypothetical protein